MNKNLPSASPVDQSVGRPAPERECTWIGGNEPCSGCPRMITALHQCMLLQDEASRSLPPTRTRHRGNKINAKGRVSALCFQRPRAIDMKRATWVMSDDAVTCPKCRALIDARSMTPNDEAKRPTRA